MRTRLPQLLREQEPALVATLTEHLRSSGDRYRQRPVDEIRSHSQDAVSGVLATLDRRDSEDVRSLASTFAHQRLASNFTQAETLQILQTTRQVLFDAVRERLSSDELVEAAHVLDEAMHRVVSLYTQAFCSLCTARQDERRVRVERHLESVIERSRDAIVLFGWDRIVRDWNPGAEAMFGFTREEMIGRSLDVIMPADPVAEGEIEAMMKDLARQGHARVAETRRQAKDGTLVWVDVRYTAVVEASGRILGIWAIFRDIGERKHLEEAKIQAERLATIGTMSARLAHEVRNPLASIGLNLDLLRDNLEDLCRDREGGFQENRELLTSIDSEVQRIQRVVEDYLRFARLPKVVNHSVELNAILERGLELLHAELAQRQVQLELDLTTAPTWIRGDEGQLWQAILNIVRNAIEAMPDGGSLRIATRVLAESVECEIADTGPGMSREVQENLFRPFFTTKRGGTGLGMALTQEILREHQATLHCESEVGEGSRFWFSLPFLSDAAVREPADSEAP